MSSLPKRVWVSAAVLALLSLSVCVSAIYFAEAADQNSLDANAPDANALDITIAKRQTLSAEGVMAQRKIAEVDDLMRKMRFVGLGVMRVNDQLAVAKYLFNAEEAREAAGFKADYTKVNENAGKAKAVAEQAFEIFDEITLLKETTGRLPADINTEVVWDIYYTAESEMKSERYEVAGGKVEEAYEKMSELQSGQARASAFYSATTKNIFTFLESNWAVLLAVFGTPLLLFAAFYSRINRFILAKRIGRMEKEKKVIDMQIMDAQARYFEKGDISETLYRTRTEVYNSLRREIVRKEALLEEEMKKTSGRLVADVRKGFAEKIKSLKKGEGRGNGKVNDARRESGGLAENGGRWAARGGGDIRSETVREGILPGEGLRKADGGLMANAGEWLAEKIKGLKREKEKKADARGGGRGGLAGAGRWAAKEAEKKPVPAEKPERMGRERGLAGIRGGFGGKIKSLKITGEAGKEQAGGAGEGKGGRWAAKEAGIGAPHYERPKRAGSGLLSGIRKGIGKKMRSLKKRKGIDNKDAGSRRDGKDGSTEKRGRWAAKDGEK